MVEHALAYASRGWWVFPCRPRGKEPLSRHGFLDATTDPAVIRAWWRRWPTANIGLATGRPSGLIVLDIDPRHGGDESLLALPPLPETVECLTGGGGRHVYLEWPGFEVRCSNNALGPGLDLKADGGYTLAPPSVHPSGRRYEWEISSHPDEVPVAPMPDWLLEMVGTGRTSAAMPNGCHVMSSARLPVGRRTLEFVARGAPVGQQRDRAVRAARNLLSGGYSVEAAAEAVWSGLRASPWDPDREPWTRDDAYQIASDLASKPAPPLRPLERVRRAPRVWTAEVPA